MAKRWETEEIDFLYSNFEELTYKEMGEFLGRKPSTICMFAKRLGLVKKMNGHAAKTDEYIFIMDNYKKMTAKEMAVALDRSVSSVRNIINKMRKSEMIDYKYNTK